MLGGVKGIVNKQNILDEYFLAAFKMGNTIEEFCEAFDAHGKHQKGLNITNWLDLRVKE